MTRTGQCLCGAVTYSISGDPVATAVCHCHRCQRQSGSAFSVNVIVLPDQFAVTGPLKAHTETDESGDTVFVQRKFCGECGSAIVSEMVQAGTVAVKAGTLHDRSDIAPNVEVWCTDRQPWVDLPDMAISLERES